MPHLAAPADIPRLLRRLAAGTASHAWAIHDLLKWPERSKFFFAESGASLSYLLVSGHPASRGCSTVVVAGEPEAVAKLLAAHLPDPPVIVRETDARLLDVVKARIPTAKSWLEQRMDVVRGKFRPRHKSLARRLTEDDASALARFQGAPPHAVDGMKHWLRGAFVMGCFEGADPFDSLRSLRASTCPEGNDCRESSDALKGQAVGRVELAAIGSTIVELPELWVLASIETRADLRGRGFGTEVASALTAAALERAPLASLTVRKDNAAAIGVYEKLGYSRREDRIWVDLGAGGKGP